MIILAGDIGGTRSRLCAVDLQQPSVMLARQDYLSQDFSSLSVIRTKFIADYALEGVVAACFGLPGPVQGRNVKLTNLPWQLDADEIEQQCGIPSISFINDFQAAAMGIDLLDRQQLICLQQGSYTAEANRLVVGAGTGLGAAAISFCNGQHIAHAGEGGHIDFAPVNELQQRLQQWLWQFWPHVSYERILSGAGLEYLYAFFSHLETNEQARQNWPQAEQVHSLAEQGEPSAVKAIHAFVQIYAAYIGNLLLFWPASGGVYIAGGIATKLESWMRKDFFLNSLHSKGRMRHLMESAPIFLVTETELGVLGAIQQATLLYKLMDM